MPSHTPGFTGESVPERTFTHGSLELLDRYEATFAIHDLQLMGAWNEACSDASHGPTSMVPERLFSRLSTSLNGPLVSNGFFSNPFTIVQSNLWHQIRIGGYQYVDRTSVVKSSAVMLQGIALQGVLAQ